jgi:hypothetical protein
VVCRRDGTNYGGGELISEVLDTCTNLASFGMAKITKEGLANGFWFALGVGKGSKLKVRIREGGGTRAYDGIVTEYNKEEDVYVVFYPDDSDTREHNLTQCVGDNIVGWHLV